MIAALIILLAVPAVTWYLEERDDTASEIRGLIREEKQNERERQQRTAARRRYAVIGGNVRRQTWARARY